MAPTYVCSCSKCSGKSRVLTHRTACRRLDWPPWLTSISIFEMASTTTSWACVRMTPHPRPLPRRGPIHSAPHLSTQHTLSLLIQVRTFTIFFLFYFIILSPDARAVNQTPLQTGAHEPSYLSRRCIQTRRRYIASLFFFLFPFLSARNSDYAATTTTTSPRTTTERQRCTHTRHRQVTSHLFVSYLYPHHFPTPGNVHKRRQPCGSPFPFKVCLCFFPSSLCSPICAHTTPAPSPSFPLPYAHTAWQGHVPLFYSYILTTPKARAMMVPHTLRGDNCRRHHGTA